MESALEIELQWRLDQWHTLKSSANWPNLKAEEIRDLGLYKGAAGVYRDAQRTGQLIQDGITVSIRNSADNYADEITDNRMFYSYPKTLRKGQDDPEIQSLKNAMIIQMPIFVISDAPQGRRSVRLGWIEGCEDSAEGCLVKLDDAPEELVVPRSLIESEFSAKVKRNVTPAQVKRIERDPKFKFAALALYKSTCAVTDIKVERMLDAAHIIPVSESGSDHPLNSLLLTASVHRTFDAHYWSIDPETLKLATRKIGPSLIEMKISRTSISHLETKPHLQVLESRWESFLKATSSQIEIAS